MKLLDLFCGAGGAAVGYHHAGFTEIVGVDNRPQKNYPFAFVLGDALEYLADRGKDFDVIHASPPCQHYSALAAMHADRTWPDLIPATQAALEGRGQPYVIENVEPSPLMRASTLYGVHGILLCGSMFGLGVARGQLRRHRIFESSVLLRQPACQHRGRAVGVYGHGGHSGKHRMLYRAEAAEAMGIDWMNRDELAQAIPPAYTEFIGRQLL
jgi:DNA (cytosine-5)-methyltransferase 1